MDSGGSGRWRSRASREARPKPMSRTSPSEFTRMLAGLISLCTSPRWWALPAPPRYRWQGAATHSSHRHTRPAVEGPHRPGPRVQALSRRAHGLDPVAAPPNRCRSSSRSPYSCASRIEDGGAGCARRALRRDARSRRHQRANLCTRRIASASTRPAVPQAPS